MKRLIQNQFMALLTISFINIGLVSAQDNCKVLLDAINAQYEGECKKGLADGFGTAKGADIYVGDFKKGLPDGTGKYTWANGNVFEGTFKKGVKEGKGTLIIKSSDGNQRVQTGYWRKDVYIGEYENPYEVTSRSAGVLSVSISPFENKVADGDILIISISHKGRLQQPPQFSLSETVGSFMSRFTVGMTTQVIVGSFPFGFSLGYMNERLEIKIYQKGSYKIDIDYNIQ